VGPTFMVGLIFLVTHVGGQAEPTIKVGSYIFF